MKTIRLLFGTTLFLIMKLTTVAQSCLTCPENIVVKADSGKGGTYVNFPAAIAAADCGTVSYAPVSGSFFQLGSSSVIVTTASGQRCSFTVTVTDNEPPALSLFRQGACGLPMAECGKSSYGILLPTILMRPPVLLQ